MKKNKKIKKNKILKQLNKRKFGKYGVFLALFLSIIVLVINTISASFSWFSPTANDGMGVEFKQSDYMRSEKCSFKLIEGTQDAHGAISYSSIVAANGPEGKESTSVSVADDSRVTVGLKYYQIEVTNADTENASDISLYFKKTIPAGTTIGVVKPSNSCTVYSEDTSNVNIVRNAYVKKFNSAEVDPGILRIEFYIRCASTEFSFTDTDIELLYN